MKTKKPANNNIPDWQRGNESKMGPMERLEKMQEWLKNNNIEIRAKLEKKVGEQEGPVVGFVDL